jgi:hypothetical protein
LSLFTAATTSSAATLYMNGSNSSYLKTTIPNQSNTMTALRDSPFVGINCNAPETNLDVKGSVQIWCDNNTSTSNRPITTGTYGYGLGVDNLILKTTGAEGSNKHSASILFSSSTPNYPFGRISGIDTVAVGSSWFGDLVFETQAGGVLWERMRLKGNGFVGINTSTPTCPLTIGGLANLISPGSNTFFGVGAVGLPVKEGDEIVGDTIVLFVKVSVPARVAIVPVVGSVIFVSPILVKVVL